MASRFGLSLDAIYYSAFALLCAYFIISGASTVDILVAYPLFFILLSSAALQILLYFLQLWAALKKTASATEDWSVEMHDYKGTAGILAFEALALWIVYSSVSPANAGEFFAPPSLAFLAISLVQVFYHTYPSGKMALKKRLKLWVESAHKFGSAPGLVALAGGIIGAILFMPAFGQPDMRVLEAVSVKFIVAGIIALTIYLGLRGRRGVAWVGAGCARDLLMGIAAFIIAFFLFEFIIKDFTQALKVLAWFASAYALLAYIVWRKALAEQ